MSEPAWPAPAPRGSSAQMSRLSWAAALLTLGLSQPAFAGWTAQEQHKDGQGQFKNTTLSYQDGKLRIEAPDNTVIVALRTGKMLLLSPTKQAFAEIDLPGLAKVEQEARARMLKQLEQAPAEIQKQMKARIEQMDRELHHPKPLVNEHKRGEVLGTACALYSWKGGDGDGEVCVAKQVKGVSFGPFLRDAQRFLKLASKAGASARAIPILRSAKQGFPLSTKRSLLIAPKHKLQADSELSSIKKATLPASTFKAPAGYKKLDFMQLMMGR